MPAVLYHIKTAHDISDERIVRALATAGLFGNVAKTNASISGAEVGCQGEVGVACAWQQPLPASCLAAPNRKLNMQPKWDSNTTSD